MKLLNRKINGPYKKYVNGADQKEPVEKIQDILRVKWRSEELVIEKPFPEITFIHRVSVS